MTTTTIKAWNLAKLRTLIAESHAKIARGAKRAGRPVPAAPEITVVGERTVRRCSRCQHDTGTTATRCECGGAYQTIALVEIEVTAERPKLAGWELLACVEPVPGTDGNIIARVPGSIGADLDGYRAGALYCDHCQTKRNRSETFVVRHEDGEIKVVGRSCLADFLGGVSPADIIARLEWVRIVEECESEGGSFGGGRDRTIHPADWVAQVAAIVRVDGWMSSARARALREAGGNTQSTADAAQTAMFPPSMTGWSQRDRDAMTAWLASVEVTGADVARAMAALSWAVTMDATDDYTRNLKLTASATHLEIGRMTSILASILSAWGRATGTVIPGVTLPERAPKCAEYVGAVGDKVRVAVTVEKQIALEGQYGSTTLHIMRSTTGHKLTWNSSSEALGEGWRGWITGTVKRQEIYRDEHSTQLTRCSGERLETLPEGAAFEVLPASKKRAPKARKAVPARDRQCIACAKWCTSDGCADHGPPCRSCGVIGCVMLIPHGSRAAEVS